MSLPPQQPKHEFEHCLRFDDDTDLAALGLNTEAHDWRLPANLPAKPKGLALGSRQTATRWIEQELEILQYRPDWRVWIVPVFAFSLMLSCLSLASLRLSIDNSVLLLMSSSMLLILAYSAYTLRQQRLTIDKHGVAYSATTTRHGRTTIDWPDLVGIASERCFVGRTLILMSRNGVDHSIRIAYLPSQQASQLIRLLRTQLARQAHD